jgi:hypothetical protein
MTVAIGVSLNAQQNRSRIQFVETEHNFGRFAENAGRQTRDFVFTNIGTEPLVIQNVSVSCGCTTPTWTRSPIPAGGQGKITAIYDPQNRQGQFNQTLSVRTNSDPATVVLTIRGEVVSRAEIENAPVFNAVSTTIDIGKMRGSEQKDVEFRFQNTGKSDLIISNIRTTCGCTAIQQGSDGVVKPGEWSSIKASFNAAGISGRVTRTIIVYTNDPQNSEVILMLSADIEQTTAAR